MTDATPEDFVDFLRCLASEACDFVIVGAHALAVHGAPRATGDLDVLVRASEEAIIDSVEGTLGDVTVRCIGLEAMLANKLAAGRAKRCRCRSPLDRDTIRREGTVAGDHRECMA